MEKNYLMKYPVGEPNQGLYNFKMVKVDEDVLTPWALVQVSSLTKHQFKPLKKFKEFKNPDKKDLVCHGCGQPVKSYFLRLYAVSGDVHEVCHKCFAGSYC